MGVETVTTVPNAIDWTTVLLALIALIGSLTTAYFAYLAKQTAAQAATAATESKTAIVEVSGAVYELGKRVDGRLTKLLKTSSVASRAEGKAEGVAEERAKV